MSTEPQTLVEAVRHFADPEVTHNTMVGLRWPSGVHCPTCGRTDVRFIATRRMWECKEKHPKKQFSSKVGTIFEDSPLSLDKWFVAIWQIANCKNAISSYELSRAIGVTQKTAWFMLHRIRLAMQTGAFIKSGGEFEADETFIGGRAKNMSAARRAKSIPGSGVAGKQVVMGVLKRGTEAEPSKAVAAHVINRKKATVQAAVRAVAEPGAALYTDALRSYTDLASDYIHEVVDHAVEYVRDHVHTNGMENFWSLFKRALKGTYVSVEPFHLDAYVKEQTFRFNERKDNDNGRFRKVLGAVSGKGLTYKELKGDVRFAAPT
ncbi:MAG: IS1595 family transposase [Acidocella sp.]|nr:IS1595 family transposase [Acidocella sp.]